VRLESLEMIAVIITAAYIAPDAPRLGKISGIFRLVACCAVDAEAAATAPAHVSALVVLAVEEAN